MVCNQLLAFGKVLLATLTRHLPLTSAAVVAPATTMSRPVHPVVRLRPRPRPRPRRWR